MYSPLSHAPFSLAASVWALIFITMSNAISWDKRRDMFLSSFIWALSLLSPHPPPSLHLFHPPKHALLALLSVFSYFILLYLCPCLPISLLFIISLKCDTFLRVCLHLIPLPRSTHSRPTFYARPLAIGLYFVWLINNLRCTTKQSVCMLYERTLT